ncbi:MAG: PKD domain-containing protein [Bacteroidales bacterium]|jgi:PKD repeat protein|nr:MAG: Protease 1 precursor [Bacteroidetes bacterium ADurb.Bin028]
MKKNLLIITTAIITILAFASCQKEPSAKFTASKTSVVTGEVITFTNATVDGYSYEWNFGDGTTSTEENPTHAYEDAGTYNVQLTSFSKNGKKSNASSQTITVTKANEIKYDGNKYSLTKGYLEKYGDFDGLFDYYNFDVYLVNDAITVTQDDAMGTGDMILLELWSASPSGINPGTYNFANNYSAQTFSAGILGLNYNIATEIGTVYEATGGTVTISQSGTDYIFDVTFTLANGKTVNAYYKGAMIIYDQTNNPVKKHSGK